MVTFVTKNPPFALGLLPCPKTGHILIDYESSSGLSHDFRKHPHPGLRHRPDHLRVYMSCVTP